LALTAPERQAVVEVLHSERFQDKAPLQVYATLLDDGQYLCSPRTMYRILTAEHEQVKERRRHVPRTHYSKPDQIIWVRLFCDDVQVYGYQQVSMIRALFSRLIRPHSHSAERYRGDTAPIERVCRGHHFSLDNRPLFGYETIVAKGQRHGKDWCGTVLRSSVQRAGGVDDL
jgi:hypothetical protein